MIRSGWLLVAGILSSGVWVMSGGLRENIRILHVRFFI